MTNKVQKEETPNPYNKNKPWHKGEDKPFLSSDTMYFEEPSEKNKLFKSSLDVLDGLYRPDRLRVIGAVLNNLC